MCPNPCDSNSEKINWLNIKSLLYNNQPSPTISFKYDHTSDFKVIRINHTYHLNEKYFQKFKTMNVTRKRRGRSSSSSNVQWPTLYSANQPITIEKKNDLMDLSRAGLIPEEYRPWIM